MFGNLSPFFTNWGPASATQGGILTATAQTIGGAKTFNGAMVINQTASGQETPLTISVSDDSVGKLQFRNETPTANTFLAGIKGISPTAATALTLTGAPTTDDGSAACVLINAVTAAGGNITGNTLLKVTNNGAQRLLIDKNGQVTAASGFAGTTGAFSTSATIGSGTAITQVKVYTQTITPASVAANTTAEQTFTVTGLTTADTIEFNPGGAPTAGTGIVGVRVSAADTLAVTYSNNTAGALTPSSGTARIVAIRS